MKSIAAFLFILCATPVLSAVKPSELTVLGTWQGKGEYVGVPFTACAKLAPYLDDTFVRMDYSVHFGTANASPRKSETFYALLDGGKVEGVSIDNRTNAFQISGTYSDGRMSTQWFKSGKAVGRSEWRLSDDGRQLLFASYGVMQDGTVLEIGEVALVRIPAGGDCAKP